MKKLYENVLNNLDYVTTKLYNMVDEFYMDDLKNPRFTPNIASVESLEDDLFLLNEIIANGVITNAKEFELVNKYNSIAKEFRVSI